MSKNSIDITLLVFDRVTQDWAGHAVTTTAASPEFGRADLDDLDTSIAQEFVGVEVAIVANDHTRLEGDDVIRVIPLLALGGIRVATRRDNLQFFEVKGLGNDVVPVIRLGGDIELATITRPDGDRLNGVHHVFEYGDLVHVKEAEYLSLIHI